MGSFTVEAVIERKSFYFFLETRIILSLSSPKPSYGKKIFLEWLDHSLAPKEKFLKQFLIFIIMDKYDQ